MHIMLVLKQRENVEYFKYVGNVTNDARRSWKIKSITAKTKEVFVMKKNLFVSKLNVNLRKKIVKGC
jgi:hypothetical protein